MILIFSFPFKFTLSVSCPHLVHSHLAASQGPRKMKGQNQISNVWNLHLQIPSNHRSGSVHIVNSEFLLIKSSKIKILFELIIRHSTVWFSFCFCFYTFYGIECQEKSTKWHKPVVLSNCVFRDDWYDLIFWNNWGRG